MFSLKAGAARFHAVGTGGEHNFIVTLLDQNGGYAGLVANKIGAADVSTAINIPKNGVDLLEVEYEGSWTIGVQQ